MTEERTPKFKLGDAVNPIDNTFVRMRVIGVTHFLDGGVGYVCSHWSHTDNAQKRHTMSEVELTLFGTLPEDDTND